MRIAVNATIVDDIPSGLGIYTINIVTELWKLHKELDVYTSHPSAFDGMRVFPVSSLVRPSFGMRGHLARFLWTQSFLPMKARRNRTDILFVPTQLEGMMFPHIPQVITIHDVLPLRFPGEYPRMRYYFRYFLPVVLKKSMMVIADSESTKRDLLSFYGMDEKKIRVVYGGVQQDFRSADRDAAVSYIGEKYRIQQYIVYVGNLLPHKNLQRLIEAYALVSKRIPHHLVIIGRKDPRFFPDLDRRASELGVRDRIVFLDYISRGDLPHLYRAAEAFVFTTLCEGFGLPVLEAMASGTPVICSNTSSLPEVVGDAGIYVNPEDPGMIAEAIRRGLDDEILRKSLIAKGYERAKLFTWHRAAQEILDVLKMNHS